MSAPIRIQLSRAKGWRMPENTVKVDRTTIFGNPYSVVKLQETGEFQVGWMYGCFGPTFADKRDAVRLAVETFRKAIIDPGPHHTRLNLPIPYVDDCIKYLRGRNLACWCKPGEPCHADVLLELANAPAKAAA